jgi:hypothetical protein
MIEMGNRIRDETMICHILILILLAPSLQPAGRKYDDTAPGSKSPALFSPLLPSIFWILCCSWTPLDVSCFPSAVLLFYAFVLATYSTEPGSDCASRINIQRQTRADKSLFSATIFHFNNARSTSEVRLVI